MQRPGEIEQAGIGIGHDIGRHGERQQQGPFEKACAGKPAHRHQPRGGDAQHQHQEADAQQEEIKLIKKSQLDMLEKISGYSVEEAKQYLIKSVEADCTHEMDAKVKEVEAQFKDEAYTRGISVTTTLVNADQKAAYDALRRHVLADNAAELLAASLAEPPRLAIEQGARRLTFRLHQQAGDSAGGGDWLIVMREVSDAKIIESMSLSFKLTAREAEVLYWVVKGKINRDIGDILGASPATVKKHLERVFAKLGVADRMKVTAKKIMSERVGAVVARGDAELGFQQASELLPFTELDYLGPIPDEVQQKVFFSAGVLQGALNPEGAQRFIRYLASPAAAGVIESTGLTPVAKR